MDDTFETKLDFINECTFDTTYNEVNNFVTNFDSTQFVATSDHKERYSYISKSSDKLSVIKADESAQFIRNFNDSKPSTALLKTQRKAGELLGKAK